MTVFSLNPLTTIAGAVAALGLLAAGIQTWRLDRAEDTLVKTRQESALQIARVQGQLVTCQTQRQQLVVDVERQNTSISNLQAEGRRVTAEANTQIAQARQAQVAAERSVQSLLQRQPSQPGDRCRSASDLIDEEIGQ